MGCIYILALYVLPLALLGMMLTDGIRQYLICQLAIFASALITYIKSVYFYSFIKAGASFKQSLGLTPINRFYAVLAPCSFVFCIVYNIIYDGFGMGNIGLVALLVLAIYIQCRRNNNRTL